MTQHSNLPVRDRIVFRGASRAAVKRKAIRWWSRHAAGALPLRDFLAACRMDSTERIIVFAPSGCAA
ncbi:MAG: hypothetical protein VX000_16850, partial [Myxococcota bacterium]|nr:hypothetical protein [Myxococcota bacterium]